MRLFKPYWFSQVEDTLGYSQAMVELTKAINSKGYTATSIFNCVDLDDLLYWEDTPQGHTFWFKLHNKNKSILGMVQDAKTN